MDSRASEKKRFFLMQWIGSSCGYLQNPRCRCGALATADPGASGILCLDLCYEVILLSEYVYKHFYSIRISKGGQGSHL